MKIEVMIEHLHEHQQTDNSVSLYKFLVMHYITDDSTDQDNERDKELPYKSPNTFNSIIFFDANIRQFSSTIFKAFINGSNTFLSVNDSINIINFQTIVWQPPKITGSGFNIENHSIFN